MVRLSDCMCEENSMFEFINNKNDKQISFKGKHYMALMRRQLGNL